MLVLCAAAAAHAQSDTTAPVVQELSFAPTSIDTRTSDQTVTVGARITDALSGFQFGCFSFRSPSSQQFQGICMSDDDDFRFVGDELDGMYLGPVTFPQFAESGTWRLYSVYVVDDVGNPRAYDEAALIAAGFPTTLDVTSAQDTTAPILQNFVFAPGKIDTSNADQTVTVTLSISDDLSGVQYGCVTFRSPSGQQQRDACIFDPFPISGDELAGSWSAAAVFPQFSESGSWHVDQLYVVDDVGNQRFYSEADLQALKIATVLDVASIPSDTAFASLAGFDFAPRDINTSFSDQPVTLTLRITDALSGADFACVYFRSPSSQQFRSACVDDPNDLTTGTELDGIYQGQITFPQFSESGTWRVYNVSVEDDAGNQLFLTEAELIAASFPTTLSVVSPTPGAPTILGITPGDGQLSVAFTPGADGTAPITNYEYSVDNGNTWVTRNPPATTSPLAIAGLSNGTTYQVRLRAVNANGAGTPSLPAAGTPSTTPGAPVISGITPGNLQLTVAFTPGADGGSAITNYQYSIDGGGTWTARTPAATTSPLIIGGLANGVTYQVQLRAVNAVGVGAASASMAGTPAGTPEAPLITGIKPGNAQLGVIFTAGGDGGLAITNYRYSVDGGATWTTRNPASTASPLVLTGLTNGTTYQIQLRAVNANGDGAPTPSVAATPALTSDETVDGFNPGADGNVLTIAVQSDARILVGGAFTMLGGGGTAVPRNKLGRLNADESVDGTFNPGTNIAPDSRITNVVVQPNGSIVVASAADDPAGRRHIGRLNADGTRDVTFDFAAADNRVLAVALQADGKVVVGGIFTTLGRLSEQVTRYRIGRFNADGTVDSSFNPGANGDVAALAIQPDGRILVGGNFTAIGGGGTGSVSRQHLARLNADGSVDMSFDPGVSGGSDAIVRALRVQTDGRILVGGRFTALGGAIGSSATRHNIGRLHADGSIDSSFVPGPPGAVTPAGSPIVETILLLSNGTTLVGGISVGVEHADLLPRHLARLNADGSLDADFEPRANGAVSALAPQADGKILVGGAFTMMGDHVRNRLARIGAPIASTPTGPSAPFTDDPIVAGGTVLRAVHIQELRARIDALRVRFGLGVVAWTDATLTGAPVRAVHIQEMRDALIAATDAAFLQGRSIIRPVFADSPLTPAGSPIRALHIQQLRAAVVALEQS